MKTPKTLTKPTTYLLLLIMMCYGCEFKSFNPGAARVNIKIFDISAETYQQPLATLQAFSKNSTQVEVTKKQSTVAGHKFEYDDANEKVTADLYANVEREVKWVISNYMANKKNPE